MRRALKTLHAEERDFAISPLIRRLYLAFATPAPASYFRADAMHAKASFPPFRLQRYDIFISQ